MYIYYDFWFLQGFLVEEVKKVVEGYLDVYFEVVKVINEIVISGIISDVISGVGVNYGLIVGVVGVVVLGYWYFFSSFKKDDKQGLFFCFKRNCVWDVVFGYIKRVLQSCKRI